LLQVTELVKFYRKRLAVDGVSFEVRNGEIVGLLGPNGAGKTTILRCVTGIVQPTMGTVVVDGINIKDDEEEAKRRIAFVPEVPTPYDMLTVYEHLRFVAMGYNTLEDFDSRAQELMKRFDLADRRDDLVLSLSKGMKQKLAIACAFIHEARVILLDEPLIGIDPNGAHELKNLLSDARADGKAILTSTHMLDTAEKLCDRIIILREGKIVAEGNLSELHDQAMLGSNSSLEEVFLRLTQESDESAFVR
jgi:ABC-2 type transport system ATP-binding protein